MPQNETLTVAVWSTNYSYPVTSMKDWADFVEKQAIEAKKKNAAVLLMPEYAAEQWMHFKDKPLEPTEQIAWMASHVGEALPLLKSIAQKHDILLIPGTFPCHMPGHHPPFVNRAHIFFPDGNMLVQDKLCLTPKEKNLEGWHLSTGNEICTFMFQGWKIAVFICLDIELPALAAKVAAEHIDLVLVPSMTKKLAGYYRVYDCAKARAVELQAAVGVCGAIGGAPGRDANISGAAMYLPCEEKFGHNGTLASAAPTHAVEGAGPMIVQELPLGEIRKMRLGGAEVWPGGWTASLITVCRK